MSEQIGIAAITERQTALASRHGVVAEADRVLTETLASAHEAMRDSVQRLDAIAAEIERARELAVDTALGAREFQKLLLVKQREIASVVAEARDLSRSKSAVLQRLQESYSG